MSTLFRNFLQNNKNTKENSPPKWLKPELGRYISTRETLNMVKCLNRY